MEYYNLVLKVKYPSFYNRRRLIESSYIIMSSVNEDELSLEIPEISKMMDEIISKKSKIGGKRTSRYTKIRHTLRETVSYRIVISCVHIRKKSTAFEEMESIMEEINK